MNILIKEFTHNGHLQSLGAAGLLWMSSVLLKTSVSFEILLITYLVFYAIYLYNRLRETGKDNIDSPERTTYIREHKTILWTILATVTIVSAGITIYLNTMPGMIFVAAMLCFGILYTEVFKELTQKLPMLKNITIAFIFAMLVFVPGFYYAEHVSLFPALLLFIFVFGKVLLSEIFLDVRDTQGDGERGLNTLPALWSREVTLKFLVLATLAFTPVIPLVFTLLIPFFGLSMLALLFIIPVNLLSYLMARKGDRRAYFIGDGELLISSALLLIGTYIFSG